jgi:prepilin-type N-terminal cleavage/methylation domain-containing protein
MLKLKNIRQRGISLIEVLASIAIMALIIAGAVSLFSSAESSQRANNFLLDLTQVRTVVKKMYANQSDYGTADITNALRNSGMLPTRMVNRNNAIFYEITGGAVTVTGAGATFTVTFTNVPGSACNSVIGALQANTWSRVRMGTATAIDIPVNPATTAAQCVDGVQMTFTSR